MFAELENLVQKVYNIEYDRSAPVNFLNALSIIKNFLSKHHFLKEKDYLSQIKNLSESIEEISGFKSDEDRLLHLRIQKLITNLARNIISENKKIFIVHGRNIQMRDKLTSFLGRLKLDYVVLQQEYNGGATIIEKFIKNAEECDYAIVLFSADDIGKLNRPNENLSLRIRQNVILELGYFLAKIGRRNIAIFYETGNPIENPSDFTGIVYEAFDEFGAWKGKAIKEMRNAGIYIDQVLADRA